MHSLLPCALALLVVASCATTGGSRPTTTTTAADAYVQVVAGKAHTCALRGDGRVVCWGRGAAKQRCSSDGACGQAAPPDAGVFTSLAAGARHTCGLQADGHALCWGDDSHGEGQPPDRTFTQLVAGDSFSCGLQSDGSPRCWGTVPETLPRGLFTELSAGAAQLCGRHDDGTIECSRSQLEPTGAFTTLAVSSTHACAVSSTDGSLQCTGAGTRRGVCDPSQSKLDCGQSLPPAGRFTKVSVGSARSCAVREDGAVVCWGAPCPKGRPCSGSAPTEGAFVQVASGDSHDCALRADGTLLCWGLDSDGQVSFTTDEQLRAAREQREHELIEAQRVERNAKLDALLVPEQQRATLLTAALRFAAHEPRAEVAIARYLEIARTAQTLGDRERQIEAVSAASRQARDSSKLKPPYADEAFRALALAYAALADFDRAGDAVASIQSRAMTLVTTARLGAERFAAGDKGEGAREVETVWKRYQPDDGPGVALGLAKAFRLVGRSSDAAKARALAVSGGTSAALIADSGETCADLFLCTAMEALADGRPDEAQRHLARSTAPAAATLPVVAALAVASKSPAKLAAAMEAIKKELKRPGVERIGDAGRARELRNLIRAWLQAQPSAPSELITLVPSDLPDAEVGPRLETCFEAQQLRLEAAAAPNLDDCTKLVERVPRGAEGEHVSYALQRRAGFSLPLSPEELRGLRPLLLEELVPLR